jgi:NAD(P)-dependent dehydrogenase (short-subunit alcohol dehydrogenase family)
MSFALRLLRSQLCVTIPIPTASFTGRTVVITGGNTGLGFEAALHFVRLGASRVIIACRTLSKGLSAKTTIEEKTGCAPEIVQVWELSLSSYASVKAFAEKANRELDRLDVVSANAAMQAGSYRVAEDNEETITVNVVSTFLLTLLLLPKLRETKARFGGYPIVSMVNSDLHFVGSFPERKAENILAALNDKDTKTMDER